MPFVSGNRARTATGQPPSDRRASHDAKAGEENILSNGITHTNYPVEDVAYYVHEKRGAPSDAPRSMRVDYRTGYVEYQSEWICFEHTGYARQKAELWWKRRSNAPMPNTAREAVQLAVSGALCETKSITVRTDPNEEYDRIVGHELGEKPFYREPGWEDDVEPSSTRAAVNTEDIPF
jgi:DNA repair protein RadD